MPRYDRKTMCNECPFRVAAPPGWLGPWQPKDLVAMIRADQGFICHQDVAAKEAQDLDRVTIQATGQHCVGMLRSMNADCKRSRDRDKAAAQSALRQIEDQPVLDPRAFLAHHTRKGPNREHRDDQDL